MPCAPRQVAVVEEAVAWLAARAVATKPAVEPSSAELREVAELQAAAEVLAAQPRARAGTTKSRQSKVALGVRLPEVPLARRQARAGTASTCTSTFASQRGINLEAPARQSACVLS